MKRLIKKSEIIKDEKFKDRGKDDEVLNHMETSTKAKTLFAHKLLHMWYKNPEKTNWSKKQIENEHTKVVKAMIDFGMNHNMVSAIDRTLPKYLQEKSGKE